MWKTKTILTHGNRSPKWNLNMGPPKYKTRALATASRFSRTKSTEAEMRESDRNRLSRISWHCFDSLLRFSKLELAMSQNQITPSPAAYAWSVLSGTIWAAIQQFHANHSFPFVSSFVNRGIWCYVPAVFVYVRWTKFVVFAPRDLYLLVKEP
jgi:hypothetical protein